MPDLNLPKIGVGTGGEEYLSKDECKEIIPAAIEIGYRHFDTAQYYENERYVGECITSADVPRRKFIISNKIKNNLLDYDGVLRSTKASLDKMGLDYVDILYVHWPAGKYNPPETLEAFDLLLDEGAINHIGVSNFSIDLIEEAKTHTDNSILVNQVEMHPFLQQQELVRYVQEEDMFLVAYAPLARGKIFESDEITHIARKHDITQPQVSLAWLSGIENVVPIPKTTSIPHLEENYASINIELDTDDVELINSIDEEVRLLDREHGPWN